MFNSCGQSHEACGRRVTPQAPMLAQQLQRRAVRSIRSEASRHATPVMASTTVARHTVSSKMAQLKAEKKVAFIPFLCAGDPDLATTEQALLALDKIGADVIELGVPYSDPLADGPVIHCAATRAIEKGVTLDRVLEMVGRVAPNLDAPLVLFTYFNPILRRGIDDFCQQVKAAGAAGLLVPDISLEDTGVVREGCHKAGLELVLLTTPTTPPARMAAIAAASEGFVYLVSVTGVTGVKTQVEARVEGLVKQLHELTDKPVSVGFGVSTAAQAQQIASWGAEGVIVGSALVRALGESGSADEGLAAMEKLACELRSAIPR